MLKDRRGITLSMPTIVIVVLAVLVLLIVALSFTGGMRTLIEQIQRVVGTTTEPPEILAKDRCETLCTLNRIEDFCRGVTLKVEGKDRLYSCLELNTKCSIVQEDCLALGIQPP